MDTFTSHSMMLKQSGKRSITVWILTSALALGLLAPVAGTLLLEIFLPRLSWMSLPFHSALEVAGAVVGFILAAFIVFSRSSELTSRKLSIVLALISMSVLDLTHGCVPTGQIFVWLHSIAVLAGGIFFASAWLPLRKVSRGTVIASSTGVLLIGLLLAVFSVVLPEWIPDMIIQHKFTPVAAGINLSGGILTVIGGFAFAWFYYREQDLEHLAYLLLCTLFGSAGVLFYASDIWHSGWWFWHLLRFSAYLLPFWIGVFVYLRKAQQAIHRQACQAKAVAEGDLSTDIIPVNDQDELGVALQNMTMALRRNREQKEQEEWVRTGLFRLNETLHGDPDLEALASKAIREINTYLEAPVGAFYTVVTDDPNCFSLTASYAFTHRKNLSARFRMGEGLVGQVALEKHPIVLKNLPDDYVRISSQLGDCAPSFIGVYPVLHEQAVNGVIEIGFLREPSNSQQAYLLKATAILGLSIQSAFRRVHLKDSLQESKTLAEELQTQQEELKASNEELEEKANALLESEEELKTQQEELQTTNEELEEKTEYLEEQKQKVTETAKELEVQAKELARNSRYKSEFLANMSHELRTPLNSLLILSGTLAENSQGNLTEEQVESAKVIQGSGKDLLSLINEILDLSKVEAGQMDLYIEDVPVNRLAEALRRDFQHVADDKNIEFNAVIKETAPPLLRSDEKRIRQILKNLVSNAIKFTAQGSVSVIFSARDDNSDGGLTMEVIDTGSGIPAEKRELIFEAFRQVDGTTARKHGGTGLGLSISRELTRLLGGTIELESELGKGSTFRVRLPLDLAGDAEEPSEERNKDPIPSSYAPLEDLSQEEELPTFGSVQDDRNDLGEQKTVILVIEDDSIFAKTMLDECHSSGFSSLIASSGEEGLFLAEKHNPDAILLDLNLPGINGWSVLDRLKNNVKTRHIPVHIMSAEDPSRDAFNNGAIGFLSKPVEPEELKTTFARIDNVLQRKMKNLLVVEDDKTLRKSILQLIGNGDVYSDDAGTGEESLQKLRSKNYDCIILDLNLPDMSGFQLLEKAETDDAIVLPPVIVYTGRELTREEETALAQYSESIIVKGVQSRERLFDEASLFLHRIVENMPEPKRKIIEGLHDSDNLLKDKTVLIVDDDMRNLFALSNALTAEGVQTVKAQDGKKALKALEEHPNIGLILMDIMMPVMDGYETMRQIRKNERFKKLPIIALTAKAMKEDRGKCLKAGANDYLSKPIDISRLISMMKVWMYR